MWVNADVEAISVYEERLTYSHSLVLAAVGSAMDFGEQESGGRFTLQY